MLPVDSISLNRTLIGADEQNKESPPLQHEMARSRHVSVRNSRLGQLVGFIAFSFARRGTEENRKSMEGYFHDKPHDCNAKTGIVEVQA